MDFQFSVVIDKTQVAKFVHKKSSPALGSCRSISARQQWEELAIQWHFMASQATRLRDILKNALPK
jgi:hypothetical protein